MESGNANNTITPPADFERVQLVRYKGHFFVVLYGGELRPFSSDVQIVCALDVTDEVRSGQLAIGREMRYGHEHEDAFTYEDDEGHTLVLHVDGNGYRAREVSIGFVVRPADTEETMRALMEQPEASVSTDGSLPGGAIRGG